MGNLLYFAYGSNMCTGRLRCRVSSADSVCIAKLQGHALRFHKRSSDGSGKANAFRTNNPHDAVWGVMFKIDDWEKPVLDRAEGLGNGYIEAEIPVLDTEGIEHRVLTYVAQSSHIEGMLRPYSWYKRFVMNGARQHNLPPQYVAQIDSIDAEEDQDRQRDAENRTIDC